MESRLKLKISRMFRSSFGSCKPKNTLTDVMENPIFIAQNRHDFQKIEPLSPPKVRPFPSICRPKLPESMEIEKNSFLSISQRKKITDRGACFVTGETEGRTCPPASPSSPSSNLFYYNLHDHETREKRKKPKKVIRKPIKKNKRKDSSRLSSSSDNDGWFSSEEEDEIEDETETFFSSRSFSSDSSESQRRKKTNSRRKRAESRRRRALTKNPDVGLAESFAVVKRSSDPQSDFRTSMVEMIIEKQIFAAEDLEKLLQCFLSLNSSHHHRVIVQVFTEIWDALFSYCRL